MNPGRTLRLIGSVPDTSASERSGSVGGCQWSVVVLFGAELAFGVGAVKDSDEAAVWCGDDGGLQLARLQALEEFTRGGVGPDGAWSRFHDAFAGCGVVVGLERALADSAKDDAVLVEDKAEAVARPR